MYSWAMIQNLSGSSKREVGLFLIEKHPLQQLYKGSPWAYFQGWADIERLQYMFMTSIHLTTSLIPRPHSLHRTPVMCCSNNDFCYTGCAYLFLFLALAVNSSWFQIHGVTCSYSSHLFLCSLVEEQQK